MFDQSTDRSSSTQSDVPIPRLVTNRMPLSFIGNLRLFVGVKPQVHFNLNQNTAKWVREILPKPDADKLQAWMDERRMTDSDKLQLTYTDLCPEGDDDDFFYFQLDGEKRYYFNNDLFQQELGRHLQAKGLFIKPATFDFDFSAYQKISTFNDDYDLFRRIDFRCSPIKEELTINLGSEHVLVTRTARVLNAGNFALDENTMLAHHPAEGVSAKTMPARKDTHRLVGYLKSFSYKDRYENLREFAETNLHDFDSKYLRIGSTGFREVEKSDFNRVYVRKNLLIFGNGETAINAATGMREHGPLHIPGNAGKRKLLFIYRNRDDADTLHQYLKHGYRHFPGLSDKVGIPAVLDDAHGGLSYTDTATLPGQLSDFLDVHYPDEIYPDTVAIVIGSFRSDVPVEAENTNFIQAKNLLMGKGIVSQLVPESVFKSSGMEYFLLDLAATILAKCGGIPWTLAAKESNELIVGFYTKLVERRRGLYMGGAVFFDNAGRMGGVKLLPISSRESLVGHLKSAIEAYTSETGAPDRLIIHYYKQPRKFEIQGIRTMLENALSTIPLAIVEVNEARTNLDICFDADYGMGIPESGVFVKVKYKEFLLFNNNRRRKHSHRKIIEDLPIRLILNYSDSGGFNPNELISQVYEFSRMNWKELRQVRVPVTTSYPKALTEFAYRCHGDIPENKFANNIPWFI